MKLQTLNELADVCGSYSIELCLENTNEKPGDLNTYFKEIPSLSFCLDIAHANLFSEDNRSLSFLKKYGHKLTHIHMCDNFGGNSEKNDLHLPLGIEKIDFKPILKHLKKINYDNTITLEVLSRIYREEYLDLSRKILKRLIDEI